MVTIDENLSGLLITSNEIDIFRDTVTVHLVDGNEFLIRFDSQFNAGEK